MALIEALLAAFTGPPANPRPSDTAWQLFKERAEQIGDAEVSEWLEHSVAFAYNRGPCGYAYRRKDGSIFLAIRSDLLRRPASLATTFAACHELGHVKHLLRGEQEAPLFSRRLYKQELEASAFGYHVVRAVRATGLDVRFKCRMYHRVLALEAAFPVLTHVVAIPVFFSLGAALYELVLSLVGLCRGSSRRCVIPRSC